MLYACFDATNQYVCLLREYFDP